MASKRKRKKLDDIVAEVFRGERSGRFAGKRAPKRKAVKRKLPRSDGRLENALIGAALEAQAMTLEALSRELQLHKENLNQLFAILQQHDQRIHGLEQAPDAEPVVFDEGHPPAEPVGSD